MTLPIPLVPRPRRRSRPAAGARPRPDPDLPARPGARHPARPRPPARPAGRPLRPVAPQRRRRPGRPGRGGRHGQLHRPVPDGRSRPRPARHRRARGGDPRRRRPGLRLPGHRARLARPPRPPRPGPEPGRRRHERVHERDRRRRRAGGTWPSGPCPPSRTRWPATPSSASSAPGRSPATASWPRRWRPIRPPRWPSSAAWPCGCCAWPWPPPPPWPGSAPGCWRNARSPPAAAPPARPRRAEESGTVPRKATKTARFLDLAAERHGPLASIPLSRVAAISADLAPQVALNPGAARAALRKAILAAQNGDPR